MAEIWVVRHGETAWSRTGQHTGRTDLPLLPEGEAKARELKAELDRPWAKVLSSPLVRARHTAELAGLTPELDDDLVEWDYGPAEGKRTQDMGAGWSIWGDVPLGETLEQVAARTRRVLQDLPADGDSLLFAHGHVLRVLAAVYLELEPLDAKHLVLRPCGIGVLGQEHGYPALLGWNR